jgi:hypothetical protein
MAWKLTHPDSDQTIEVEADSVQVYVSQGWETVSGRTPPAPDEKDVQSPTKGES